MKLQRILCSIVWTLAAVAMWGADGPRVREKFNQGWLFERQATGSGELGSFDRNTEAAARIEPRFREAMQPGYDDSGWGRIALPHTWNSQDTMDAVAGYWRGIGWYRKHFRVDAKYAAQRVVLEVEGANEVSEWWLNGAPLGVHKSGYTSFELELTPHVKFGEDNVLAVMVDNLYHATIPPTVKTDYSFYGGIYRNVWLRIQSPVAISSVRWTTPKVSAEEALLELHTTLGNATGGGRTLTLRQEIVDPAGKVVAKLEREVGLVSGATTRVDQQTIVAKPELWSPETPSVYTTRSTLREGDRVVDASEAPLGFRWYKFDPQAGFLLNGKRVQIQGFNRHQSYPGMGNALPDSRQWKDLELMREMGANFWRTSHYPPAPSAIDAADRLGLLVWEELPVCKEVGNPDEYIENVRRMADEMIGRDANHPSVIVWGIAGEINAPVKVSQRVVAEVAREYRAQDEMRPVGMHAPRGEAIEALVDVVGLEPGKETDEKHRRFPARALMTAEYSAALPGRGVHDGGANSEETAVERHAAYLAELNRRPWMAGGAIWLGIDNDGESYDEVTPHVVAFGMADIWRIPKEAYYFYQSQWSARPMLHIEGHWTWPGEEGRKRKVEVFSNVPRVELRLNGRSLGVKEEDAKERDATGLAHPRRIWEVEYQPGTLEAVAEFGDKPLNDTRKTAGPAAQIVLETDAKELRSGDPESVAYITATVADKDGTPVPDSYSAVAFTWYGPGELLPQTWPGYATGLTWNAVAGLTRVAFRSTARTGEAVISATSPGLKMGRVRIMLSAPGKPDEMEYLERFAEDETPGAPLPPK